MKKVYLILILTICSFLQTFGQQFTGAKVFGGQGIQGFSRNFFDKLGNHYQVVLFQTMCTLDSNGYSINIPNINGHITIGDGARIAGMSGIVRSVEKMQVVGGAPALPIREWHRLNAKLIAMSKGVKKDGV